MFNALKLAIVTFYDVLNLGLWGADAIDVAMLTPGTKLQVN